MGEARRTHHSSPKRRLRCGLTLLVPALVPGCLYPTPPDDTTRPVVSEVLLDSLSSRLGHNGVLTFTVSPTDTSYRLAAGARVTAQVETSTGDQEEVELLRRWCPARPRSQGYACNRFLVTVRAGYHIDDVEGRIQNEFGRYLIRSATGRWASVVVFQRADLVRRLSQVVAWKEVADVELEYPAFSFSPPSHSQLTAAIPVDTGAAIRADGVLQIRPGETLTVRYVQPGGVAIAASQVAP